MFLLLLQVVAEKLLETARAQLERLDVVHADMASKVRVCQLCNDRLSHVQRSAMAIKTCWYKISLLTVPFFVFGVGCVGTPSAFAAFAVSRPALAVCNY